MKPPITNGKKIFGILLAGESISLLGTSMTSFAVMIWAYEKTGAATALALLGFFVCLTYILASPFAGVLVDRWDRRRVMLFADLGAGLMTALLLTLNLTGHLQIWHLYLAQGISGVCQAFQEPAFSASISLIIPKEGYTRSNGLLGLGRSASRVFAPVFAGALLPLAGLNAVMAADLSTLVLAVVGLLLVRLPRPTRTETGQHAAGEFWHQLRFGADYIFRRPGLRNLVLSFFSINLFATLTYFAVLSPMILARTGNDVVALGVVRTVMGVGGIVGGAVLSAWGGSKRKVRMYLVALLLSFLIGDFLTAISRSTLGWCIAGFYAEFSIPFIIAPYFSLWQEIVPPDVQGRVFSTREMVQVASQPIGYLFGGLLADRLFEPAMNGPLGSALGWLVGTGPGSGMAAMFLCTAVMGSLIGVIGLLTPSLRNLENPEVDLRGGVRI